MVGIRHQPIMLILCYAAVLKFLPIIYIYSMYYAHVKGLYLFNMVTVLLEYIKFIIKYGECSIRVMRHHGMYTLFSSMPAFL